MKNKKIKIILQDLYAIDEDFVKYELELIRIIEKLLISRPDTKFDKKFARKLRAELLKDNKNEVKNNLFNEITSMFTMKKLSYAGAGMIVIVLAVIIWQSGLLSPNETRLAFAPKITKVGDKAFGSLTNVNSNEAPSLEQSEALGKGAGSSVLRTQSGGGGGSLANSAAVSIDSKMIMPNPYSISYTFTYVGDEFSVEETTMAVLKRIKDKNIGAVLAQELKNFNFGNINLNKFSNLTLQNISLVENKDFGYYININSQEGNISVNENYEKWQNHRSTCSDQQCYEAQRLKESDIPADDVLIKIANNFLAEKNINTSYYGEPVVNKEWLLNTRMNSEIYIPDMMSIIYPLVINDKKVYDESGSLNGMNISVDVKLKRVSSINYMTQTHESSEYETEMDVNRILKFAEQGGLYTNRYFVSTPAVEMGEVDMRQAETKELKIGTPTLEYVKIWQFNNDKRENSELLVPAFVFPILEKPEGTYFWQDRIIIPIVKEMLDEADKQNNSIKPTPRPLPEPVLMPLEDGDEAVIMEKNTPSKSMVDNSN